MKYLARFCAASIAFAVISPAVGAENDSSSWRRWAILATSELRQSGLSDLLFAHLAEQDSLELVEREQLDLALRELDLDAHFGADSVQRRLRLGKLLKADALLLLSVREHEDQRFLRLVISDCVWGARLWEDFRPLDQEQPAEAGEWVASSIEDTRNRFPDGIKQLIAVPPFLSKNLTHEHDHWQASTAALVAHFLSRQRGVAVTEIEEVRAIQRELNLVGDNLQKALVPLFVEGEFTTDADAAEDQSMHLTVRIKDAKGVRDGLERKGLSIRQAVELLREELPRRILALEQEKANVALTRPQQQQLLSRRAATFSAAGAFEHATALREAALLLRPEDVAERIALIRDYNRWQHARGRENTALRVAVNRARIFASKQVEQQTWKQTHAERLGRFQMTTPHVEYLIRRRQVSLWKADNLVSDVVGAMMQNALDTENQFGQQDIKALEGFFWRVYPQFPELNATLEQNIAAGHTPSEIRQYHHWNKQAIYLILRLPFCTGVGRPDDSRTLKYLFRFLTEIPRREAPLTEMAKLTMVRMNKLIALGRLPIDDVRNFYEKLKASELRFNPFYARCGLLALDVHGGAPLEPLRAEVKDLLNYINRFDSKDPRFRSAKYLYRRELERLQKAIEQRSRASRRQPPAWPASPIPPRDSTAPISFLPTGIPSPWLGITRCHDSLDVLWTFDRVDVMPSPQEIRTVLKLDFEQRSFLASDMIYSAHWDGQNIWVATMKSGIFVVSPTGEQGHIHSETGLPPYDARRLRTRYLGLLPPGPLRLHPVEPGKCVAVGQFGGNQRLWFAMIERDDEGNFQVDVMHTAIRLNDKTEESFARVDTAFPLRWTLLYRNPLQPECRLLLAGRQLQTAGVTWPPLAIDLDSHAVSILGTGVPSGFERALPQLEWKGSLLAVRDTSSPLGGVRTLTPPKDPSSSLWTGRELVAPGTDQRRYSYPAAFACDGAIYNPGVHWWKFEGDDVAAEMINERPIPLEHRFELYGASAHHGILAWNRGDQLYQVSFQNPEPEELAQRYSFVPAGQRERHHAAAEAIRRLGGQVATQWGASKYLAAVTTPQWRTIVYLPKEWSGGDAELSHLSHLFNLCELHVVQAKIGNEALQYIARLKQLEELSLVQTKITNESMKQIRNHPRLRFCHLESSAKEPGLGDDAVTHLSQLPKLIGLALAGPSFTDAALQHLQDRRIMHKLILHDTRITPAGIATLKKSRPFLLVSERR